MRTEPVSPCRLDFRPCAAVAAVRALLLTPAATYAARTGSLRPRFLRPRDAAQLAAVVLAFVTLVARRPTTPPTRRRSRSATP